MHHARLISIALFSAGSFACASPGTAAKHTSTRSARSHEVNVNAEVVMALASDLHSVAAQLKNDPKISFFSNKNDFLLRPEDIAWVKNLFGERAYFFERGGHLGNLSNEDVREAISMKVQQDKLRQ